MISPQTPAGPRRAVALLDWSGFGRVERTPYHQIAGFHRAGEDTPPMLVLSALPGRGAPFHD